MSESSSSITSDLIIFDDVWKVDAVFSGESGVLSMRVPFWRLRGGSRCHSSGHAYPCVESTDSNDDSMFTPYTHDWQQPSQRLTQIHKFVRDNARFTPRYKRDHCS